MCHSSCSAYTGSASQTQLGLLQRRRAHRAFYMRGQEGNLLKDVWELDLTRSFTSDTRGVWRKLGELPALSAQAEAVYHPPSGLVYLHGGYRQEADGEVVRPCACKAAR